MTKSDREEFRVARRLGIRVSGILAALVFGNALCAVAQEIDKPARGVAVIGGESFDVTHTAADRSDIKPNILPEMYGKCVGFARQAHTMLASTDTLAPESTMKLQLRATASNTNCERLVEIMLEDAAEEKLLSLVQPLQKELMMAAYSGDSGGRDRTLVLMEHAGWSTSVIRMHPEDLGVDELPEVGAE